MLRKRAFDLIQAINSQTCKCPAHSQTPGGSYSSLPNALPSKDYAFEMVSSTVRYGPGVTREVGYDLQNLKANKVCVMTDSTLATLAPVKVALDSLTKCGLAFDVYDKVRVEPTDSSLMEAADFARKGLYDAFLAVGGGSVIDTCKAASLFSADTEAVIGDYVNPPLGKGKVCNVPLKPLIAVPTTSGTGSEVTGISVFDYAEKKAKTGIASRAIRPTLGLIDPLHTLSLPQQVSAYSGFDVLCHALESFTAIPYTERTPCPPNPNLRPGFNGQNPVSDVWAKYALQVMGKYFERSVYNPDDVEARSSMHLAATMAGVGFGNAGVHLCHGMSYAISHYVKNHSPVDYGLDHAIIPHGLSVVITAPAVFSFTAACSPDRHLEAASLLGADVSKAHRTDAGAILADTLRKYMKAMKIEDGLKGLGYTKQDIPALVQATLPQERLLKLAPRGQSAQDLTFLFENALTVY